MVKLLMDHGADQNIPDVDGSTPLSLAHSKGYFDFVNIMTRQDLLRQQQPQLQLPQLPQLPQLH